MKTMYTLASVLFLFITNPTAKTSKDIRLDKKYKVESTFSGNTLGDDSFHLIIAKNTSSKAYDIIPYHYKNGETIQLKPVSFAKEPNVLSFHNNEGTLSLITKSKEGKSEKIRVVDIDLATGESKKSDSFSADDFKAVIREKDKNILLYAEKESIILVNAIGTESIETVEVKPSDGAQEFFKSLSNSNVDAINASEFVKNGSIKDFRAYFDGGVLTLTQEDSKEGATSVVQIPVVNNSKSMANVETLKNTSLNGKIKKSTSYFSNDKLYQLKLKKDEAKLDIFDMSTVTKTTIDLLNEAFKNAVSDKNSAEKFIKNASKNANAPTVTINKAAKGGAKVRFDYVNKNSYNYRYNWWWHHQWMMQQIMWQQQQQMQMHMRASGFGPNVVEDVFFVKDEESHFEIGLDVNGNITNPEDLETIHKDIDKKSYINDLDENKKYKHSSTVFTDNNFRYIAYDKKSKTFVIIDKALND
ncbi:hypothetical protein [Winogradskyella luteola]|uniref:Uncharacterized protein n=1 Tax=Winogradskyella luteola TaxID=2828330 RepID=A0A9X1JQQ0_9FLAO|nr:hypothetical protein [Winogradskyella luteola]MBV7269138.1 hypothetical protein [Winogradskyella luteola]